MLQPLLATFRSVRDYYIVVVEARYLEAGVGNSIPQFD